MQFDEDVASRSDLDPKKVRACLLWVCSGIAEWAMSFIDNAHHPDGLTMTGGCTFQGGVLLVNENGNYMLVMQYRLDARYFLQFVYLC